MEDVTINLTAPTRRTGASSRDIVVTEASTMNTTPRMGARTDEPEAVSDTLPET